MSFLSWLFDVKSKLLQWMLLPKLKLNSVEFENKDHSVILDIDWLMASTNVIISGIVLKISQGIVFDFHSYLKICLVQSVLLMRVLVLYKKLCMHWILNFNIDLNKNQKILGVKTNLYVSLFICQLFCHFFEDMVLYIEEAWCNHSS